MALNVKEYVVIVLLLILVLLRMVFVKTGVSCGQLVIRAIST